MAQLPILVFCDSETTATPCVGIIHYKFLNEKRMLRWSIGTESYIRSYS